MTVEETILPSPSQIAIRSAGSEELTTSGLAEFKKLLQQADKEQREIKHELSVWKPREIKLVKKHKNWEKGWLFRRLFKERMHALAIEAQESTAHRTELEEQEKLARLQTVLDLPPQVTKAFAKVRDHFAKLTQAEKIWDTVSARDVNQAAERTTATQTVDRKVVRFSLSKCDLIETEDDIPRLQNANGGDIYFYPAFALYFVNADNFALMEYGEFQLTYDAAQVIEREAIPSDSKTAGHTWAKTNKNGTPDKRFKDNYQIPVAEYGMIRIKSRSGLNEQYLISNNEATKAFATAWQGFIGAIAEERKKTG